MTRQPPIVAFSGYARAGKDAAAKVLVESGWHLGKFSGPLKDAMYAMNPLIVHHGVTYRYAALVDAYGLERVKDEYPEVRPFMQRLGLSMRQIVGEDVWVNAAIGQIPAHSPAVFVDCRYPNEAHALRARGGIVVRIQRPGVGPAVDENGDTHISETALDGYAFDAVIDNDGTLEQLRERIEVVLSEYLLDHPWWQQATEV